MFSFSDHKKTVGKRGAKRGNAGCANLVESLEERRLMAWTPVYILFEGSETDINTQAGVSAQWSPGYDTALDSEHSQTTLTLGNLPPHLMISVGIHAIGMTSSDYEGDSDILTVTAAGQTVLQGDGTQTDLFLDSDGTAIDNQDDSITITYAVGGMEQYDAMYPFDVTVSVFQPDVSLSVVDGDATENTAGDDIVYRIGRTLSSSGASDPALTVNLAAPTGTATEGQDYSSIPRSVTIPAGADHYDLHVNTIDDPDGEGVETVLLALGDPGTRPYKATDRTPKESRIDDDANVTQIRVQVLSVDMPAYHTLAPWNSYRGFDFSVMISFKGEHLDKVLVKQLIRARTEIWNSDGTKYTDQQVAERYPADGHPDWVNTPDDPATPEADFGLDWTWTHMEVTNAEKSVGYIVDHHQFTMNPVGVYYGEDAYVNVANVAKITRDMKIMTHSEMTNTDLAATKDWGYVWSNENCDWPASSPYPAPWTKGAYDLDDKKGIFSGVYGVEGLDALNG